MRTTSIVALAAAGAALLAGGALWFVLARAGDGADRGVALTASDVPNLPAELVRGRAPVDLADDESAGELALQRGVRGRHLGFEAPLPDALRAVRGKVVDVQTGEPLAGFTLTLLSRRPRTVEVVTDTQGEFCTESVLASGVVSVSHKPDVADPRYAGRYEIAPGEFLLPRADEHAPAFPVALGARAPRRVFEVDVRRPDGGPAVDATVELSAGRRDERGVFLAQDRDFEIADALGRARFALFGDDAFQNTYRLEAEQGGSLVSEPREFDPPLPTVPERLDLFPGGVLRVRVRNDDGRGLGGVSLWLSTPDVGRASSGRRAETDAAGEAVLTGLRDACWTIAATHPWTGESVERAVDLSLGEYADVDLRLSVLGLALGAQGVVQDENGYPLPGVAVHVQAPGSQPVELATDAFGQFQFWTRPGGALLLGFGGAFLDDHFEPSLLSVPFGATAISVRRLERRGERTALFEIVDGASRAPAARAAIWLSRPEPAALSGTHAVQRWSAPSGVASVQLPLSDEAAYAIDAPGFLRAQGRVSELIEEAGPGNALRVVLVPGFERAVEVRDRVTRALLADAVFFAPQGVLGATDGGGRATLQSETWPAAVRVECTGYVPLAWDPLAAGWPGTVVWMEPVDRR